MNQSREPIFEALRALLEGALASANGGPFKLVHRRLRMPDEVEAGSKPCLFITEHGEAYAPQGERLPNSTTLSVDLFIYTDYGDTPDVVPATELNNLLDAVDAALAPSGPNFVQTLGGKVSHCWVEGELIKVPGDLDGKGLAIVPLRILTP